jgi:predicted nucleotidyltransferase
MKRGTQLMVSESSIDEVSDCIAREFAPDRIILFGSHATGAARSDSDVDLLVVMPHGGQSLRKGAEIRRRVRAPFAVDIIVRSPDEVRQRVAMGDQFLREITEKGRVLYESAHA